LTAMDKPPRLLDQMRDALRARHYSLRTERAYLAWVRRFIYFHHVRHPAEMGEVEINAFLTHLAVAQKVSASTQNQALAGHLHRCLACFPHRTQQASSQQIPSDRAEHSEQHAGCDKDVA
jgi:hypothetical protein